MTTYLDDYAFGNDPIPAPALNGLIYTGSFTGAVGNTVTAGLPVTAFQPSNNTVDYRALFSRPTGFAAAGLSYTVQFTADLINWQSSAVTPTVLADDGTNQIVSVPYPVETFLNGQKAQFFRVIVTLAN